jgi:hypothetical protein
LSFTCLTPETLEDSGVPAALQSAINKFTNLRSADIDGGITSDGLIEFARSNPLLRALVLSTIPTPNHILSSIMDLVPCLTSAKLYNAEGCSWAKHPTLARLDVYLRSSKETETEVLSPNLPKLEEFTAWSMSRQDRRPFSISGLPLLRRVDLLTCPGATLIDLPSLEYLHLRIMFAPCKIEIKRAPNLVELEVDFGENHDLQFVELDVELLALKKLTCSWEDFNLLHDFLKSSLLKRTPQLEDLSLDSQDANVEQFDELWESCPSLKRIHFNHEAFARNL